MSLSLGEKLRQAREERGISISEVAEQTRISPLYLKSIEKDDYKPLPGGIFNKGFVRSYARYIGFDEDEALADYAQLVAQDATIAESDHGVHKPEVLSDDYSTRSSAPVILVGVLVLALIGTGLVFLVRYIAGRSSSSASNSNVVANANTNTNSTTAEANIPPPTQAAAFSVELKAVSEPVWVRYTTQEGDKERTLSPNETLSLEVSDTFRLSFARIKAASLQFSINGKRINLPADGTKGTMDIEVNRGNVAQIVQSGEISGHAVAEATPRPRVTPRPTPRRTPLPVIRPPLGPINIAPPIRRPGQ